MTWLYGILIGYWAGVGSMVVAQVVGAHFRAEAEHYEAQADLSFLEAFNLSPGPRGRAPERGKQ